MTYSLSDDIQDAGQLFKTFLQHGGSITGLEMLSATLEYASRNHLSHGDICILLDNLICEAGVRVVSATLHNSLCQELPTTISIDALNAAKQVAARARAAVLALKDNNYNYPEWESWTDEQWLEQFGDEPWTRLVASGYDSLTAVEYERCRPRFLEMLHTMEGHYCVVNDAVGDSLIHTEGMQSGYNVDLDYNSHETVCDSSGFCQLKIDVDHTFSADDQNYDDDWSLDYVVEYTNHEKAGETMSYEASTVSHANDTDSNAVVNEQGEWLDSVGDTGIVTHHGEYCEYNPEKKTS